MKTRLLPALLALAFPLATQAALHDRGGGLIYDDVLKVTWLQDANYIKTSGYDADGYLTWGDADTWARNFAYFDSARGVTWTGWRLPKISLMTRPGEEGYAHDGSADSGENITRPSSELAYMFHVNLGLESIVSVSGDYVPTGGVLGGGWSAPTEVGKDISVAGITIKNLQNNAYWYDQIYFDPIRDPPADPPQHWAFYMQYGLQEGDDVTGSCFVVYSDAQTGACFNVWPVLDGDVAAVPEPETSALLLAGLGLTGWLARRRSAARVAPA